jgi:hypothetical protein
MAGIRRIGFGNGINSITAFHAFSVAANGDLQYTFSTDDTQKIQTNDQADQYVMYEAGTSDYRYEIDANGELVMTFTTPS